MTDRPTLPPHPAPWGTAPEPPSHTGRRAALGAGALVLVAAVATGGWLLLRGDDSADAVASPTFTTGASASPEGDAGTGAATVTTVTVRPEPQAATAATAAEPAGSADAGRPGASTVTGGAATGTGPLACDGRGVLIVQSVMGDSPSFRSETDNAVALNPGAVVMPPGSCPSLRPSYDGADVYAVVVDYGYDLASLCAAEVPGVRNARVLDDDTSYRSPC